MIYDGEDRRPDSEPMGTGETTGRYVIVFVNLDANNAWVLQSTVGVASVADSRDFDDQRADPNQADATVFAQLGIAVTTLDPSQLGAIRTAAEAQSAVASIASELIHHPLHYCRAAYARRGRATALQDSDVEIRARPAMYLSSGAVERQHSFKQTIGRSRQSEQSKTSRRGL
jgi:hypothetical protein